MDRMGALVNINNCIYYLQTNIGIDIYGHIHINIGKKIHFPFNGCNDQCKYLENNDILIVNSNLYGVIQFVNEENIVFIKSCDHRH